MVAMLIHNLPHGIKVDPPGQPARSGRGSTNTSPQTCKIYISQDVHLKGQFYEKTSWAEKVSKPSIVMSLRIFFHSMKIARFLDGYVKKATF